MDFPLPEVPHIVTNSLLLTFREILSTALTRLASVPVSYTHLLVWGNSYVCAKISGIVSCFLIKGELSEDIWLTAIKNFDYTVLKKFRCLVLSDRKEEKLQKQFIREVINEIYVDEFTNIIDEKYQEFLIYADYDILFIDCIHYEFMVNYKELIINMAVKLQEKEIVLRYPLLGLYEKADLYRDKNVVINQMIY